MSSLNSVQQESSSQWCSLPVNWLGEVKVAPRLQPNTWVRLLVSLNPFAHDEALLLCQESASDWVAWIPNHGEAILQVNQFCLEE